MQLKNLHPPASVANTDVISLISIRVVLRE